MAKFERDGSAMLAATPAADLGWLDEVDNVDQSTVDTEGPQYPFAQWVHGDKRLKAIGGVPYTGGWFMNDSQGITAEDLTDWTAGELNHEQGEATPGFFARDLTVAVIRSRRCWRVRDGDQTRLFAWEEYERAQQAAAGKSGLSGRLQVLTAIQGLEHLGSIVLTMGGSVSRAFAPGKSGDSVMNVFARTIITPANTLVRKRAPKGVKPKAWPYRAFWLTVGPGRDAQGAPIYTTVGEGSATSTVSLPVALGLADKLSDAELGTRFVGRDNLDQFSAWYAEAEEWAHLWDAEALSGQRTAQAELAAEVETASDNPAYVAEEAIPF